MGKSPASDREHGCAEVARTLTGIRDVWRFEVCAKAPAFIPDFATLSNISDNSSGNGLVGSAIDFSPLVCYTIPHQLLKGVIRFRRDMLRSDRASWILVGHVKNEEKK